MKGLQFKDASNIKTMDFGVQIKEVTDAGRIEGLASTFGNVDHGRDVMDSKAFDLTLKNHEQKGTMPKMLWQHDPNEVIGIWEEMSVEPGGLAVSGRIITDIPMGQKAHVLLRENAIDSLSIGYKTIKAKREDGGKTRRLLEVDLWEVSVVTFPMNPGAKVRDVKNDATLRDVEGILRDAGLPSNFARLVVAHGYDEAKSLLEKELRDADRKEREKDQVPSALDDLKQRLATMQETLKNV